MENETGFQKGLGWVNLCLLALGVIVIQIATATLELYFIGDWQTRGQFGDSFGTTTSLFSGLGIAGLIYTLVLQQRQIESSRNDSLATRRETEDTLKNQQHANHLSALTFLMEHYDGRLFRLNGVIKDGPAGAILNNERLEIQRLRTELDNIISSLHREIIVGLGGDNVR